MKSEIAFQRSGDPFTRIILFLILSVWRRFWDDDQLLIILLFECNYCNIIALTFDYLFPVCFLSHSVLMLPNGSSCQVRLLVCFQGRGKYQYNYAPQKCRPLYLCTRLIKKRQCTLNDPMVTIRGIKRWNS